MLPRRPPPRSSRDAGAYRVEYALHGLAVAGPDPYFEARLRGRLLAVSAVQAATDRSAPRRRRSPRWLPRAVAAGAAGVVGVAGIGVAASRALPGQPLYGAKRQIEAWQLAATSGAAERGREQLAFARTRLAEVEALSQHQDLTAASGTSAAGSTAGRITETLRRMDAATRAGTTDLVAAGRAGDRRAAPELLTFTGEQTARLAALSPLLPAPAAAAVATSQAVLRQVAALARTLPNAPPRSAAEPPPQPAPTPSAGASLALPRPTSAPPATASAPDGPAATGAPAASPTLAPTSVRPSSPAQPGPFSGRPSLDVPTPVASLLSDQQSDGHGERSRAGASG